MSVEIHPYIMSKPNTMIHELCTTFCRNIHNIVCVLFVIQLFCLLHAQTELNSSEVEYPSYKNLTEILWFQAFSFV